MNITPTVHSDFIFSITADWVLILPILAIVVVLIGFFIFKRFKT